MIQSNTINLSTIIYYIFIDNYSYHQHKLNITINTFNPRDNRLDTTIEKYKDNHRPHRGKKRFPTISYFRDLPRKRSILFPRRAPSSAAKKRKEKKGRKKKEKKPPLKTRSNCDPQTVVSRDRKARNSRGRGGGRRGTIIGRLAQLHSPSLFHRSAVKLDPSSPFPPPPSQSWRN